MPTVSMKGKNVKVDFMIIGAARSATTSLCKILASHPDIGFSSIKEPQFFSKHDWREQIDHYNSLFTKDAKIYGEGSTNYTKYPFFNKKIHSDIFEYNPKMKFIYIMRNPIDRMISHYRFAIERGYTSNEINKEILENRIYLETSKYYSQIKLYSDQFGKENIKLIFFDAFKSDPKKIMDEIFEFIGIHSIEFSPKLTHSNKSWSGVIGHKKYDAPRTLIDKIKKGLHIVYRQLKPKSKLNDQLLLSTKKWVISELKDDIHSLEKLSNSDLSHWFE